VTQLLISFCFTSPPGYALAKFDTDSEALEWVKLDQPGLPVYGGMGICPRGDGYIVIFHAVREMHSISCIGELDHDLRLCRMAELKLVSDGHSVIEHDGALLVVSSGTNQVIRVDWPAGGEPEERVYFELEPGFDTLHMNSLRQHQGKLYLSMFGPRTNGSWRNATQGQVICLDDRAASAQGIHHPHGLFAIGDELLCVGSMSGSVRHVAGPARAAFPKLDGYLRGVACDAHNMYVGTSRIRDRSKSSGDKVSPSSAMPRGIGCGLHILERETLQPRWLDLSPFAAEIYDIHVLPPGTQVKGTRRDAMASRLHALNGFTPRLLELAQQGGRHAKELVNGIREPNHVYYARARLMEQHATRLNEYSGLAPLVPTQMQAFGAELQGKQRELVADEEALQIVSGIAYAPQLYQNGVGQILGGIRVKASNDMYAEREIVFDTIGWAPLKTRENAAPFTIDASGRRNNRLS